MGNKFDFRKLIGRTPTVVVHDGIFHADDVLAVALLKLTYGDLNIIRTRDESVINSNQVDFVLDVGAIDFETEDKLMLDHHQETTTDNDFYECGVKKAACGKLFDKLVEQGIIEELYFIRSKEAAEKVAAKIRQELLYPIEAQDNGQDIEGLGRSYLTFVSIMNPPFDAEGANPDFMFGETVDMVFSIVDNIIRRAISAVNAETRVADSIANVDDDGVIYLGDFAPWSDAVVEYNEATNKKATVVVFKATNGNWNAQVVPVEKMSFESHVSFPQEWRGKRGDQLSEESGIGGGVFCHPAGFLSGWTTLESAMAAAHIAAKCWNKK